MAEYIWIDADGETRSKSRHRIHPKPYSLLVRDTAQVFVLATPRSARGRARFHAASFFSCGDGRDKSGAWSSGLWVPPLGASPSSGWE
ncbi:hypothetical protein Ct61P_08916 [Colletotrichum tofieldiae]|nr:hypothetical protein Ct61P_08916 [Colletotrichum tofieldiae]